MSEAAHDVVARHVGEGRLDKAAAALLEWLRTALPASADDALLLAAEGARLRQAEQRGELGPRELDQAHRRLASRILDLRRRALEESTMTPAAAVSARAAADRRPVFISYHHGDAEVVAQVRRALHEAGIDVLIDAEAMQPGQDIAAFVRASIATTRATVCIVSRPSLLSGWVVQETLLALAAEALDASRPARRFIALFLDADFLAPGIRLELTAAIDERLANLQALRAEQERRALDTVDLDGEIARGRALRNGLGVVLQRLRSSLCLDLREPQRVASLARLAAGLGKD